MIPQGVERDQQIWAGPSRSPSQRGPGRAVHFNVMRIVGSGPACRHAPTARVIFSGCLLQALPISSLLLEVAPLARSRNRAIFFSGPLSLQIHVDALSPQVVDDAPRRELTPPKGSGDVICQFQSVIVTRRPDYAVGAVEGGGHGQRFSTGASRVVCAPSAVTPANNSSNGPAICSAGPFTPNSMCRRA